MQVNREPREVRPVKALLRGLQILEALSREEPISLSRLADLVGLPPSTTYRLIGTLVQTGYVEREESSRSYRLSVGVLELRGRAMAALRLAALARPFMTEFMLTSGLRVNLGVLSNFEVLLVDRVDTLETMRTYSVRVGQRLPAHCTALGKVLLANLAPGRLHELLRAHRLGAMTANTITDPSKLASHLEQVRTQQFAMDDEESAYRQRCIAAPVMDHSGKVVAAVSGTGSIEQITEERAPELVRQVLLTCLNISRCLGYDAGSTFSRY